jgi:hypothetical protein
MNEKEWKEVEGRFDGKFQQKTWYAISDCEVITEIKNFIRTELEKAEKRGAERISKIFMDKITSKWFYMDDVKVVKLHDIEDIYNNELKGEKK